MLTPFRTSQFPLLDLVLDLVVLRLDPLLCLTQGTSSTGTVQLDRLYKVPVVGRHIIVVEDIVDTGITAQRLLSYLKEQNPASVHLVTLLDKEERRKIPIKADYVGFKVRSSPPLLLFSTSCVLCLLVGTSTTVQCDTVTSVRSKELMCAMSFPFVRGGDPSSARLQMLFFLSDQSCHVPSSSEFPRLFSFS